jgi:hypothetical protein
MSTFLNKGNKKCLLTRPIPAPQSKNIHILEQGNDSDDDGSHNE